MAHKPKAAGKTANDAERMANIPTDAEPYETKQNPIRDFSEIADNVPELVGDWNTGRADVTRENLAKLFSEGMYFDEAFGDEIKLEKRPEIADEEIKDPAALVMEGLVKIISMAKNSSKSKTE